MFDLFSKGFHGVAPSRDAVYLFAYSCDVVRCRLELWRIVQCGSVRIFCFDFFVLICVRWGAVQFGKNRLKTAPYRTPTVAKYLMSKVGPRFHFCEIRAMRFGADLSFLESVRCGAVRYGFYFLRIVRCGLLRFC